MFTKQKHNPIELIHYFWPGASVAHITYSRNMTKGDYDIVRQSRHDGTLSFTLELLERALLPIVNMTSFYKPEIQEWENVKEILYTIGDIRHSTAFGLVKLPCSNTQFYPGQVERVRIPIKARIVFHNK